MVIIMNEKIDKLLSSARSLKIDDKSKIVIMSDCHRGEGNSDDNFLKNEVIHEAALKHYLKEGYTYIELGDGDDMWEVKKYENIISQHLDIFKLLREFHKQDRLIMIVGNHDIVKKNDEVLKKYFYYYENKYTNDKEELLNDLKVDDALILKYYDYDICLLHGHQVDLLNGTLWKLSRFLVRNLWTYLEKVGIKDPTSAAKNYNVIKKVEKRLENWSKENNKIVIAGHTHRPIYPKAGEGLYFNDGSCVHPNGITCIEIDDGYISLVKWVRSVDDNNNVIIQREVIGGKTSIFKFFH